MKKLISLLCIFYTFGLVSIAQDTSPWEQKPDFNISGFVDIYYFYDFNQPQGPVRQPFLFHHNRHNEFNINLGLVKFGVNHAKYRANFTLQAGTYANDNYAAEPGVLKNIFEAYVGVSLNTANSLWLDAGIFSSHLGFESALSIDNMTLTRSLAAESSPYFLSGAKLTFNPNDKWEIVGMIVNGWQRIQRVQGNSLPSFGTQVNFHPTNEFSLNWSTFIGTDDPDATRRMRYFNNFYGQFLLGERITLIAGFDIGLQQQAKGASAYDTWYVPTIIGQYAISEAWKFALRAEYYHDPSGVIIPTTTTNGFQTTGFSTNIDYSPTQNIMCRLEGRLFNSKDDVFEKNTANLTNNNFFIGSSIALKF